MGLSPEAPMDRYHPPLRTLPLRLHSSHGWLRGLLHLPEEHGLLDHLNHAGPFLKLTEVQINGGAPLPFFALRSSAVDLVLLDPAEPLLDGSTEPGEPHRITCLAGPFTIEGQLDLLPHTRVSDFLMHQNRFLLLREASLQGPEGLEHSAALVVNTGSLMGVTERG
jgi:hypothetical protein